MEITKVVKPFITRGANTFGNIVYLQNKESPSGLEAHERNKCQHNDNFLVNSDLFEILWVSLMRRI